MIHEKRSRIFVVIGVIFLLLGAGVVLGKNTQQFPLSTQPVVVPTRFAWSDNFDSYANGSALHGQGGWAGWDNNAGATGYITNVQSHSTPNSLESRWFTGVASDMVHQFSGYNTGTYTFIAWLYVPSTETGTQFFILMNKYTPGSPHNSPDWSLQVEFSATSGLIQDYNNPTAQRPLITNQWKQIKVVIDLEADVQTVYYDGVQFISKSWKNGVSQGGVKDIACVDLYAGDTTSTSVYWDDVSLMPPAPPLTCEAGGPYSGYTGSPVQFTGNATGGTPPYTWAWQFGDGTTSTQQNPTHTYSKVGVFKVNLTVTDSLQVTAQDTATATIAKPLVPNIVIEKIAGGKGITATITNNGTANASNVPWNITLAGGFIIKGKYKSGTITTIGIGEKKDITSKVLGFGKTTITVNAGGKTKTATGFVFLSFVLGVK